MIFDLFNGYALIIKIRVEIAKTISVKTSQEHLSRMLNSRFASGLKMLVNKTTNTTEHAIVV